MGGLFSFWAAIPAVTKGLQRGRKTPARLFLPPVQQILQGDLLHLFLHGSEDLIIGLLEHRANPAHHRTLGGGIGVHTQELMFFVRFQGCIHIPHRDLLRTAEQDAPPVPRATDRIPAFCRAPNRLRITTGLLPVLAASPVLVIRRPSNTAMQIRQCSAMEHLVLMRMVFHL